jgi:ATP-dependent protease ClpP protease subunit
MSRSRNDILGELHNFNILAESREIFLYQSNRESGQDIATDVALTFIKNLRFLERTSSDNILVHLFSNGGEWDAGFAIYDSILNATSYITIVGHGAVASIATVILQAADKRLVMPNAEIMIHEGTTGMHPELTHKQAKSWATSEEQKAEILFDVYARKCIEGAFFKGNNADLDAVKSYLKNKLNQHEDWFLTPEQALNFGLIDGIIGSKTYPTVGCISD